MMWKWLEQSYYKANLENDIKRSKFTRNIKFPTKSLFIVGLSKLLLIVYLILLNFGNDIPSLRV